MDQALRDLLRTMVEGCRKLLEPALAEVLEGHYGILPDGTLRDETRLTHLTDEERSFRVEIIAHLGHIQATLLGGGTPGKAAVEQLLTSALEARHSHTGGSRR